MLKEFYKNGKVYGFDISSVRIHCGYPSEADLIRDDYIPLFDHGEFSYANTLRSGSVILENDSFPPDHIVKLQNQIQKLSHKNNIHDQYCNLHPLHTDQLKEHLKDKKVKNILIDSLFQDIEQFRYMIIKVFSLYTEVNYFINSHGTLIKLLQNELDNNMDKYPVRNPYYKHGANDKEYFNDLTFLLFKSNIYEVDNDYITHRIKCKAGYEKCEVFYDGDYKIMMEPYKVIVEEDITDIKKSKWNLD